MALEPQRIREFAERATDTRVENLASAINGELLRKIHRKQQGKKATGVDGVSKADYGGNLDANLEELVDRMKRESYKPKPSRRVYIDKPGSAAKRPLGISCYEDKLVENAVAQLLEAVYEPRFSEASFWIQAEKELSWSDPRGDRGYSIPQDQLCGGSGYQILLRHAGS